MLLDNVEKSNALMIRFQVLHSILHMIHQHFAEIRPLTKKYRINGRQHRDLLHSGRAAPAHRGAGAGGEVRQDGEERLLRREHQAGP